MLRQLELMGIKPSSVKSNLTQDEWRNEADSEMKTYISKEVKIGKNVKIGPKTVIYEGVKICLLYTSDAADE